MSVENIIEKYNQYKMIEKYKHYKNDVKWDEFQDKIIPSLVHLKCYYCDAKFKHLNTIKRHFNFFHHQQLPSNIFGVVNKPNEFKCEVCDKVFYRNDNLLQHYKGKRHIRLNHELSTNSKLKFFIYVI